MMLQSSPRLAAGLHSGLHAFAWLMVLFWLAALFRLSVDNKFNDRLSNVDIRYRYGEPPLHACRAMPVMVHMDGAAG